MRLNFRHVLSVLLLIAPSYPPALCAQQKQANPKAAMQVMKIRSNGRALPAEFEMSVYENLIDQLQKKAGFQRVYRDGDQTAASAPELITLQCTVQSFKKGSERMRQVTMVAGATSITLRCEFNDKGGSSLLVRDITGKVRFFGGNLNAAYDFAKRTASIASETFLRVPDGPKEGKSE